MLLFFWLASLHAQDVLDPIKVEAQSGPLLLQTSSPVWRALPEELQQSSQLCDTLNKIPGVMFTQNGGMGGVGSVYARGSESRHVVVLADGFRLNDPSSTGRNFDSAFVYAPFYQDLLFLRGPAPALYGGDATGGVIELIPRRGSATPLTQVTLAAGSFGTFQGHLLQDWQTAHHQGTFGMAHLRSDGFSRLNEKRHGASEADGARTTQLFQASRHAWSEALSSELYLLRLSGMAEQDAFDSTTGAGVDQAGDYTRNSQSVLGQTTRGKFERGEWWLKTGLVGQRREIHAEASDDEAYRAESWSAQLGVRRQWGSTEALLGVDGQREWQASPGVNERVAIAGGFGLLRQRMGRFTGELGARAENHQRYGGFSAGEATLTYRPRQELKLHGKAARGYKTPSLYQLYAPDTSGPLGNPDLTPESNVSSELGAEWVGAGVIGVVAFQQDFQDLIAFSVAEGYQNRGTLRVQGLESYVISPEHSWGQVTLTWTQLDFSHYSQTPLRRPPYLVTTGWIGKKGDWTLELNLRAVGGRKDAGDSGTTHLVAYETLGGILGWNYNSQQEWSLRVNNMTDRQYEDVWGYGVAPLSAMLQWTGRH